MARNNEFAAVCRQRLENAGVVALNLVSSPGAGKTTLLERTLDALGSELRIAVVAGDVQTQNDADRIARHTTNLVQAVVTAGACHLDARQIDEALASIDLDNTDLLFIENVGTSFSSGGYLARRFQVVLFRSRRKTNRSVSRMFAKRRRGDTKDGLLPYVRSI